MKRCRAPQHFAEMKGQAEVQGWQALPAACLVEMGHASLGRADGAERGLAGDGRGGGGALYSLQPPSWCTTANGAMELGS